ncbi:hypothetical protein [Vibrio sp. 10N]|uniref:hypothetical protein n=1 Tax=Vibrio sp. 10N TaxID=3058938 RepID=UPI0030C76E56
MAQAEVPHLDLLLSFSSLPLIIDNLVKCILCLILLFTPLPLVVLPLIWRLIASNEMLRPCVTGRLRCKEDKWHLNDERLNEVRFNLAFAWWVIALYDAQHGWRLIWRAGMAERSYRHLVVAIKGWQ